MQYNTMSFHRLNILSFQIIINLLPRIIKVYKSAVELNLQKHSKQYF